MTLQKKTVVIVAAMAGLLSGCAAPAPRACTHCTMGGKSDKVSCGAKSGCKAKGNRANQGS